jgi:D-alanine--D-alanine ligase
MSKINLKIAIICGGPSGERGISLNSARCVMDHMPESINAEAIYVAPDLQFYLISKGQLYCNTPSDFDFKLEQTAKKINYDSLAEFDLVFPLIYGKFGEDGTLQKILEKAGAKYIATGSNDIIKAFHKYSSNQIMAANGFTVTNCSLVKENENPDIKINNFLEKNLSFIAKPAVSGSSLGVHLCHNQEEAKKAIENIRSKIGGEVVLEEYCQGKEFTILVLDTEEKPVSLMPTEIETSYESGQIFDYRKKYLPTNNTLYHTPPKNFDMSEIRFIRNRAEDIFKLFNMKDFARIDGWLMNDGRIVFTDINPISGMEQNSFLFRQSSLAGMTHAATIEHIIKNACSRYNIKYQTETKLANQNKEIFVIFGGTTPERQVSLMSGTNVWLKLLKSKMYKPIPFLLDKNNDLWSLPYNFCLNHTVEEIYDNCINNQEISSKMQEIKKEIDQEFAFPNTQESSISLKKLSLEEFLQSTKDHDAFVFIALHGGFGENGELQKILEKNSIAFNGSYSTASAICMDKFTTGQYVNNMALQGLYSLPRSVLNLADFLKDPQASWDAINEIFKDKRLIIKPRHEGCSSGIVVLENQNDFNKYFSFIASGNNTIPAREFCNQPEEIELPSDKNKDFIIEEYIEVDNLHIDNKGKIHYTAKDGWIELTAGVLESSNQYHALNPSITISESAVLSIEEKFQGGTGVNITPPPAEIFTQEQIDIIKNNIEKFSCSVGIKNYARIDLFFNVKTNKMIIIEANSLPALTPSTVIYHQALAEKPPIYPLQFLENLIQAASI